VEGHKFLASFFCYVETKRLHAWEGVMKMRTYEVELCRTSYITITVHAETKAQAEEKAWEKLERECVDGDGYWNCEGIEEIDND
jgi:hypothetical protein